MSACDACGATFAALATGGASQNRALCLDQDQPNCCCEAVSVSAHSPGPVANAEVLVRILVAPQHMKSNGRPRPAALTDAETHGLSVFRHGHATNGEIRLIAEQLVERTRRGNQGKKAGVFGVLQIPCDTVRNFRWGQETTPSYCIYDTAREDAAAHAEAFQRIADTDAATVLGRRQDLFAQVEPTFVSVAEFRSGLLADLAPPSSP
jgi:hypothetical protein